MATQTTKAADVVALYRAETMEQVLASLRPMTSNTQEGGDLMEHPVEDGSLIADHLVLNPTETELQMLVAAEDIPSVIDEARQLMLDGELLTAQTRTGSIFNMVIVGLPRDERPEAMDSPLVLLRLRQARFITPEYGDIRPTQAARPQQATTRQRGQQQARPATARTTGAETQQRGSTLYRLFGGG